MDLFIRLESINQRIINILDSHSRRWKIFSSQDSYIITFELINDGDKGLDSYLPSLDSQGGILFFQKVDF